MMKDKFKILLIEDQYIPRAGVINLIQELDCAIDVAVNGLEVLELIKHRKYNLIFMDLGLPDIDGIRLTKKIRLESNLNKDVPIVALTAHGDTGLKDQAFYAGMNDFIEKPMTKETCQQVIDQWIKVF